MKKIILLILTITISVLFKAQISSSAIPISETTSSNGEYMIRSVSYDDEFPTLRGKSFVIEKESSKIMYEINRSFDLVDGYPYFVAISNDGKKVAYFKNRVYFNGEEHKNITYYIDGEFVKAYDTDEFINCNKEKEKCELFYNNSDLVIDYRRSTAAILTYKKGTLEKEKYLNRNFIFNKNDTVYITDSRKNVTLFDLNSNKILESKIDFDALYPYIKDFEIIKSKVFYYKGNYKDINDFENISNNEKLSQTISNFTKLKFVAINDSTYHKYKLFKISINGYLDHKGKFEIESLQCDSMFNKKQIEDYIQNVKFKTDFLPKEVDKYYFSHFFGGYRSFDDKIAEEENLKDKERRKKEFKKRLTLEKIDNIYIPKNLYECMIELDKNLNFENKKQLKEAKDSFQFNSHMGGLGMWIRNNWGINGGSRLLKYFNERGIGLKMFGNDEISKIIIDNYIKWLNGDKYSWQIWEEKTVIK